MPTRQWHGRVKRFVSPAFFCFLSAFLFQGCDLLDSLRGKRAGRPAVVAGAKEAEPAVAFVTPNERYSFYLWVVREMQEQIYAKPVKDRAELDKWANVLSQRGSLEGVYHGLILSTEYAQLERGKADLRAVRFFASEMAALDFPLLPDTDEQVRGAAEAYARENLATPLFTLKRVLGAKVLKESSARASDQEKLAAWYASFATRWARLNIPFGAEQRNRTDEAFYFRWAKANSLGLVQWELLNRVHRSLNHFGGLKFNQADK